MGKSAMDVGKGKYIWWRKNRRELRMSQRLNSLSALIVVINLKYVDTDNPSLINI